ncbi:MAG: hypothetical protein H6574_17105 [Lewinellaceae bacterium]|nr:hypothetical protein [Saprospiraceae bacterium]MCB9316686.1 hypothetical protein [Lewinellaceae bacterium]MCB9332793.1 hypothetical protein [Lewinellaceae bacterium]
MQIDFSLSEQTTQPNLDPVAAARVFVLSLAGTFPCWLSRFWCFEPKRQERLTPIPVAQNHRPGTLQNSNILPGVNAWFIAYSQGNIREGPD